MIRNLKAVGLVLAAVLATSAVTAAAASATDVITTTRETVWLTGTSHNKVLQVGSTKFECTTSRYTATARNGSSEITVLLSATGEINATPHGTSCNSSIGTATWDVNHCHFVLTGNTTGKDVVETDATVWIQCPVGKTIQITSNAGLTISVPTQTPTEGGVTYVNLGNHAGNSAIRVTTTMTGITSTCAPAFLCGLASIPTHGNNTKFTGTVDLTGYEDLGGNLTSPIEGNRIPIEWS